VLVFIYEDADTQSPAPSRAKRHRWHAVAIVATATACAAARACKDNRYLSAEAPRLPLAGCDATRCECRYGHFDDRRRGPRRAQEKNGVTPKRVSVDNRARRGRRATDHTAD
jgi:hypothetical protein